MGKTIGDMMEEFRIKAGAREYKGHEFLDLNRFADDTRHMIIFDVVSNNWRITVCLPIRYFLLSA